MAHLSYCKHQQTPISTNFLLILRLQKPLRWKFRSEPTNQYCCATSAQQWSSRHVNLFPKLNIWLEPVSRRSRRTRAKFSDDELDHCLHVICDRSVCLRPEGGWRKCRGKCNDIHLFRGCFFCFRCRRQLVRILLLDVATFTVLRWDRSAILQNAIEN